MNGQRDRTSDDEVGNARRTTRAQRTEKQERARELRQHMTEAERVLWSLLRRSGVGLKCKRQALLAGWIPDFTIHAARLVIEADGGVHDHQRSYDAERTRKLEELGYRVLRFSNEEILERPREVMAQIRAAAG
jgi:very-short-patch-repair endonuclease